MREARDAYRHCGLDPPVHRDENDEERSSSRCKRTRWHSVIGDSSIQRGGDFRFPPMRNEFCATVAASSYSAWRVPRCGYCLKASMTGRGGCVVFTLTLVLSHQGRGGMVGWRCLVHPRHTPPCGYCLKASTTALPLRIADQVRNDGKGV